MQFPPPGERPDLLIIAGEHSGDEHAARMVRELLAAAPEMKICALGGESLRAAGAELLFDLTEHSVVGLFEVLKNYGFFKELFDGLIQWIAEHRPRAICFVDYPGFNLRVAQALYDKSLSRRGGGEILLYYYIGPQIWAWKAGRRFKMARLLDGLGVIFPFEVKCYADTHLPVAFVGHPFVDPGYELPVRYAENRTVLLLPGSRKTPVKRIFPVLLKGFRAFQKEHPEWKALALYPSEGVKAVLDEILAAFREGVEGVTLRPVGEPVEAQSVLTSSGTMSLNCALAGIPGAIVYRANPFTYFIGRRVVKIPYLGIANILLDRPAYPEYLQGAATPQALAGRLKELADSPSARQEAAEAAHTLRMLLGEGQPVSPGQWLLSLME